MVIKTTLVNKLNKITPNFKHHLALIFVSSYSTLYIGYFFTLIQYFTGLVNRPSTRPSNPIHIIQYYLLYTPIILLPIYAGIAVLQLLDPVIRLGTALLPYSVLIPAALAAAVFAAGAFQLSLPNVAVPAVVVPAIGVPALTVPAIAVPAVAVPAIAVPAVAAPAVAAPAVAVPAVAAPAVAVPAVAAPAVAAPVATPVLAAPGGVGLGAVGSVIPGASAFTIG